MEVAPVEHWLEAVIGAIEVVGLGIESLGVVIIATGIVWGIAMLLRESVGLADRHTVHRNCRQRIGRAIVLGLEILVAADIIHTVAIEPTMENVGVLSMLIVVRTFINWTLILDLEDRWPWQPRHDSPGGPP